MEDEIGRHRLLMSAETSSWVYRALVVAHRITSSFHFKTELMHV